VVILHMRNIPEDLYERLQRRAEAQLRSLSAEVITLLTWAVEEAERTPEATLAGIHGRRSSFSSNAPTSSGSMCIVSTG